MLSDVEGSQKGHLYAPCTPAPATTPPATAHLTPGFDWFCPLGWRWYRGRWFESRSCRNHNYFFWVVCSPGVFVILVLHKTSRAFGGTFLTFGSWVFLLVHYHGLFPELAITCLSGRPHDHYGNDKCPSLGQIPPPSPADLWLRSLVNMSMATLSNTGINEPDSISPPPYKIPP